MPKTFIKKTGGWTEIKSIFVKKTTGWAEVKNVFLKKTSGWVKVFTKVSLPDTTTSPSIRTTNNSGSGTIYDGPVAVSPIYLNENLFGKDGVYTNYTSIFGRKFTSGDSASALTRSLVINGDLFTSGGGVTTAIRQSVEEKYLFYELTVQNGSSANEIYPISSSVFMIKSQPYSNSFTTTGALEVGNFVTANIDIEYYYYNRPTLSSSYVKWYVGNYFGDTSGTPVQTTSLTDALDSTSSTQYLGSDLLYIDSSYFDKYVTAILVVESSWTRYYGYATSTYQLDYVYAGGGGKVSSPLSFSNIVVKDYNGNSGLDNRSLWPTGTINKYTATLTGYVSGTTIRIRYRIFNSNNSTYYKPSTATASTASASWDSWNSDGSGDGYISDVSISGGTATISDNLYLDETVFNGGGAYPGNWELHVELSAIKSGGTRVYYINPYDTYYISKRIDSSVSVSPNPVAVNTNTTISGSFVGFPATPSTNAYPKQYKVTYGDGFNSGWLPVPEWTFGTVNPTFSLTKSYSSGGTKTITLDTIPLGSSGTTSVTVSQLYTISFDSKGGSAVSSLTQSSVGASIAKPTDPTKSGYTFNGWSTTDGGTTAVTWPRTPTSNETLYAIWTEALSAPTSLTATNNNGAIRLTFSGGSGSQYDIYYANSSTRPTDGQAFADYTNVTSPYDPPLTNRDIERWFWVRKSTGTNRSNWYPSDSSVSIRLPLLAPPTPVITNSAKSSTSLSWHWTQPTPTASQDEATSWDYALTQSTATPSSWTNLTTRPTSASPLVTSSLTANTDYYLHVKAKNKDASTTTYLNAKTDAAVTSYTVTFKANGGTGADYTQTASTTTALTLNSFTKSDTFVTPSWTGTLPGWSSTTNFQRTASTIRYGWNNGTQTWTGTINDYVFAGWNTAANGTGTVYANGANYAFTADLTLYAQWGTSRRSRGFNWQVRNANNTSSSSIVDSGYKPFTTTLDTRITVNSTNYPYLLYSGGSFPDIAYSGSSRFGRIQVYQFGTDGNEYNSPWTGNI